jgi:uncharacterized phiE125 gp8 family phage protein
MRFALERVSSPDIEPVTLTEAKRHLGEFDDVTTRDDDVTALITAAREWVEDFTGRALVDQRWRLTFGDAASVDSVATPTVPNQSSELLGTEIFLRKSPALSIVSFVSVASDGTETAVDPATYELREADGRWPRVIGLDGTAWISGVYRIVFRAGYADRDLSPQEGAEVVPERFKMAMKLWIEAMYDRDERMMKVLLDTAEGLIRSERTEIGLA